MPADWGRNKALAGYDRTHNFEFYGAYELPFGPGKALASQGHIGGNRWRMADERYNDPHQRHSLFGDIVRNVLERAGQYSNG